MYLKEPLLPASTEFDESMDHDQMITPDRDYYIPNCDMVILPKVTKNRLFFNRFLRLKLCIYVFN